MTHRLPGFHNLRVIDAVRFTPDAIPFTLYLNFDQTLIGLFILGWCHTRIARMGEWREMLAQTAPRAAAVLLVQSTWPWRQWPAPATAGFTIGRGGSSRACSPTSR